MRFTICILFLILSNSGLTQDTLNFNWQEERSYAIDTGAVWTVDALENVYVAGKDLITKYDSVGVFKFSQSIKSLGGSAQFEAVNTMKLVHFSRDQQTLCFFDNTLTKSENCIDLSDHDIYSAGMIATSNRSDKIWILDNLNSKLLLLDLKGKDMQSIEIENLKGVLELNNAAQVIERDNQLYILDSERGVFIFDIYGSMIDFQENSGGRAIDVIENALFVLSGNELRRYNLRTGTVSVIPLPVNDVIDFRILNQRVFLRTAKNVHKYRL